MANGLNDFLPGAAAFREPALASVEPLPFADPGELPRDAIPALVPPAAVQEREPIDVGLAPSPALLTREPAPIIGQAAPAVQDAVLATAAGPELGELPIQPVDPLAVDEEIGLNLAELNDLNQERTVLRRQAQDLQTTIALAPTPEEADAARTQQQEALDALALNERATQRRREDVQLGQAEQSARMEVEANKLRREANARLQVELATQRDAQAARDADLVSKTDEAVARTSEAKSRYQAVLRRGPRTNTVGAVLEMTAEALRAANEKRPVNFGSILARLEEQSRTLWEAEQQAAISEVSQGDDAVADIGRQRQEARMQGLALRQATIDDVLGEVETKLAQAQTEAEQQQLLAVRDQLIQQQDVAQAQARAEAAEQARKRAREDAELQLTLAKVSKEEAQALMARRKAARTGRGKSISQPSQVFGLHQVNLPGTEELLFEFEDTPDGRKRGTEVREAMVFQNGVLNRINALEAAIEDTDAAGWFETATAFRQTAWDGINSRIADLAPDIAKIASGGFATTEGDLKWAADQLPRSPDAWNTRDKSLSQIRALKARMEDRTRQRLEGLGVKRSVAEHVVKRNLTASVGRRDLARERNQEATKILGDDAQDKGTRLEALANVSANARKQAKEAGDEDDFLPLEIGQLEQALQQAKDPETRQAILDRMETLRGFARDRVKSFDATVATGLAVGEGFEEAERQLDALNRRVDRAIDRERLRGEPLLQEFAKRFAIPGSTMREALKELQEQEAEAQRAKEQREQELREQEQQAKGKKRRRKR